MFRNGDNWPGHLRIGKGVGNVLGMQRIFRPNLSKFSLKTFMQQIFCSCWYIPICSAMLPHDNRRFGIWYLVLNTQLKNCARLCKNIVRSQLLSQWFLTFTNTPNPYVVFQTFVEPHFCPIYQKVKLGYYKGDHGHLAVI